MQNRFNVDLKPLKRTIRFQIGCSSSRKKRISAAASPLIDVEDHYACAVTVVVYVQHRV